MSLNLQGLEQLRKLSIREEPHPSVGRRIMEVLLSLRELLFCEEYFSGLQTIADTASALTVTNQGTFWKDNTTDYSCWGNKIARDFGGVKE